MVAALIRVIRSGHVRMKAITRHSTEVLILKRLCTSNYEIFH